MEVVRRATKNLETGEEGGSIAVMFNVAKTMMLMDEQGYFKQHTVVPPKTSAPSVASPTPSPPETEIPRASSVREGNETTGEWGHRLTRSLSNLQVNSLITWRNLRRSQM